MTTNTSERDEERLRNTSSDDRTSRAMEDRAVVENREMTDDERIEMFRMQTFQHVLPDLPKIPGFHTCWLSTTNQSDTISYRMKLGYTPITRDDIPGWNFDHNSLKTGDYAGLIGMNEMLAFKISDKLYQAYMTQAHYDAPMQQDQKLINDIEALNAQAKSGKSYISSEEGMDEIRDGLRTKKPVFA
jgi:hypothetical protein